MNRTAILFAALIGALPAAAQPVDADWNEVASAEDGACTLSVTGNGQIYRIAIEGLEPGEAARYRLGNGDMQPIDWKVRADANGRFARYYMPFRWHRAGGTVSVAVSAGDCTVEAAFPWRRTGIRVS